MGTGFDYNIIVILVGALTALIAAAVTAHKTVRETNSKVESDKAAEKRAEKELDLKALGVKADVSEKLQILYEKMTEDFEERFCEMQQELDLVKANSKRDVELLQAQIEKDKLIQSELLTDLQKARTSDRLKTEAGILLIRALEQNFELRKQVSLDLNECKACSISDAALMKTLNEVKILFKNGTA